MQLEWLAASAPIYILCGVGGRREKEREMETVKEKKARETWFKLQQFCISHQENGIRFHHSDLIWYSSCRNCISYQDKWEITGKHLERTAKIGANFSVVAEAVCALLPIAKWQEESLWRSSDTQRSGWNSGRRWLGWDLSVPDTCRHKDTDSLLLLYFQPLPLSFQFPAETGYARSNLLL